MMVSDGEHSCTDKRKEKQQNNRDCISMPLGGGYNGRRGGTLTASPISYHSAALTLLTTICNHLLLHEREEEKHEFPHDIL